MNQSEPITRAQWQKLMEAQGFLCFYCGVPICEGSLDPECEATQDHLLAQSRGGVDSIWNIVAACFRCNRLKGAMLPAEFLRRLFRFIQPVDATAEIPTGISFNQGTVLLPFHKRRGQHYVEDVQAEAADHIAVAPIAASAVRYLDHQLDMREATRDAAWYEQRRAQLRQQAHIVNRLSLEMAGQMVLPLFQIKITGGMSANPPSGDSARLA